MINLQNIQTVHDSFYHNQYGLHKSYSDSDYIEYLISKQLFSWQKDLIIDLSKKITLLCGRRAGKSYGLSGMAVNHCRTGSDTINNYKKPRRVAIIGLTKEKCADVFWLPILNFANSTKMKYKEDSSKYQITFENGATINLFGNNSKAEREKIRGTEYSLIIIDEAQSQHSLEYLVTDILEPIIVGRDSQIVLSGTGSLTGYGKWADITTGDEASSWKHYTATMEQNPTIPNHEDALRRVLEEKGWTVDNITYQREYLAKNVIDTTRIVFHTIHYYEDVPKDFIATGAIVGVDYGFSDYNAFAAVVYNNERFYLVDERKFNKASVTDIVNVAREINDFILNNYKVEPIFVADNSDQSISREIYNQGIKIYNAYKTDTQMQISRLKEWLENDFKWKLQYRASEHGYSAKSFHRCCDYIQGPNLIVIKSNGGWIFGGYTTQSRSEDDLLEGIYYDILIINRL